MDITNSQKYEDEHKMGGYHEGESMEIDAVAWVKEGSE